VLPVPTVRQGGADAGDYELDGIDESEVMLGGGGGG